MRKWSSLTRGRDRSSGGEGGRTTASGRERRPEARVAADPRRRSDRDRSSWSLRECRIKCRKPEPQPPGKAVETGGRNALKAFRLKRLVLAYVAGPIANRPARTNGRPGGKTASRKPSQPIAGSHLYLGPNPFARGMDKRRGRLLGLGRLGERVLPKDRGGAQRLDSRCRSPSGGLGGDLLDQLRDPLTVLLRRKIPPAGQGGEVHDFGSANWRALSSSPRERASHSRVRSNQVSSSGSPVRSAVKQ